MNLIERAKNITMTPKKEWTVIAEENTNTIDLFKNYVAPLAAIPAVAMFIGMCIVGISIPILGTTIRLSIFSGITNTVLTFASAMIWVYVASLLVNALAPQFGTKANPAQALKLAAYSFTPFFLASVLFIIPSLGRLSLLACVYGIYIFYLGLPVLMQTPTEKVPAYTAVSMICIFVIAFVFNGILSTINGNSIMQM
jgi:hypothetical protein